MSFVSEFHAVMKHKTITHISFVSEIHAFVKYKTINHIVHSSVKLVFNHSEYVYFSFPCRVSIICVIRFNSLDIRWTYLRFSFWASRYEACTYTLEIPFFFLSWNKLRKCRAGVRTIPIFFVSFMVFIQQQIKDNHLPTRLKQDIDYPSVEFWKILFSHGNLGIAVLFVQLNWGLQVEEIIQI